MLLEFPQLRSDRFLFPSPLCSVLVEGTLLLLQGTDLRLQILLYFLVNCLLALKSLDPQSEGGLPLFRGLGFGPEFLGLLLKSADDGLVVRDNAGSRAVRRLFEDFFVSRAVAVGRLLGVTRFSGGRVRLTHLDREPGRRVDLVGEVPAESPRALGRAFLSVALALFA